MPYKVKSYPAEEEDDEEEELTVNMLTLEDCTNAALEKDAKAEAAL